MNGDLYTQTLEALVIQQQKYLVSTSKVLVELVFFTLDLANLRQLCTNIDWAAENITGSAAKTTKETIASLADEAGKLVVRIRRKNAEYHYPFESTAVLLTCAVDRINAIEHHDWAALRALEPTPQSQIQELKAYIERAGLRAETGRQYIGRRCLEIRMKTGCTNRKAGSELQRELQEKKLKGVTLEGFEVEAIRILDGLNHENIVQYVKTAISDFRGNWG